LRDAEVAALLEYASLARADLRGADLSGAIGLDSEQVRCAFVVDDTTELPSMLSGPVPDAPLRDPACQGESDGPAS
jgi:hypothetical protein